MIAGGLVAPFAEELFFRGVVQTRLVARFGPAIGIGAASLLFGAFHLDPAHAAFAACFGLVVGLLRQWSGSIRLSVLVHMTNNLLSFGLARQVPPGTPSSTVAVVEAVIVGGVLVVAAVVGVWAFRSGRWAAWRVPAEQ
jgi:membrane protease YdiL (CAAX protease family)